VSELDVGTAGSTPQWHWDGSNWVQVGENGIDVVAGPVALDERTHDIDLSDGAASNGAGSDGTEKPASSPTVVADGPRRVRNMNRTDRVEYALSLAAGVSLTMVLAIVMDWHHPLTLVIWAAIGMLFTEYLLVRDRLGPTMAIDRVVSALVWLAAITAVGVLAWMLVFLVEKGIGHINWDFLTQDRSKTGPLNPGGGALHAIVGTLQQTLIASVVAIPIGILTAVYLHEMKGRLSGVVRFFADAMSGLPSIVAGLLVFALWVQTRGHGYSGIAASAALVIVMLPIVTRTAEEVLRTVPGSLREASFAMGAPEWRTVSRVVLPTARSGLVTAAILAIARVVGETAPLILTAFGSASLNANPLKNPQQALPLYTYQLIKEPNASQNALAWTGALVLVLLVLILFVIARFVSARGARRLGGSR
jgi:phosphate transport system permease protein